MAKFIQMGDNIVVAEEIVWLNATQTNYSTMDNEFSLEYFLRSISLKFTMNFGKDKKTRDSKYMEMLNAMKEQ